MRTPGIARLSESCIASRIAASPAFASQPSVTTMRGAAGCMDVWVDAPQRDPPWSHLCLCGSQRSDLALHVVRLHDVLVHAEVLGLDAQGEPDELRQVQNRQAEVALDVLGGVRLLEIQVEVAERARGDHAVRV